eukprot:CAMPEP_0181111828 /NCGR_PEP_ID=MMETSP1071-20121207/19485_1 /TAXON_ID=35127 /ORGANISM="Thalassiosira sp., Strain NH16" /LENGTH=330 /DNA_ID=CAMNT_0023195751 /DNA_START=201 /DNA_END=1193 /DNA_ORIENTATION=+
MGHTKLLASSVSILLLVSFLKTTCAERHKQVLSANSHCNVDCYNDGYCSFTKYTDYPQKGDVGYYKSCTCRPGFGGGGCEKLVEECQPPMYKCHNGAPCEIDENGVLGCDCSAADAISDLAGYMCRRPVIQACDTLDEHNKSFCTNGGMCLSSMTASPNHLMFSKPTTHEGCQCDDVFSGDHCETLKHMPESSLMEKEGKSAGAKAGIVISSLFSVAILGALFAVWRKRRPVQACAGQHFNIGEQTFCKFYMNNLAVSTESAPGVDDDKDTCNEAPMGEVQFSDLTKGEDDLQSMQSIIDLASDPDVYDSVIDLASESRVYGAGSSSNVV